VKKNNIWVVSFCLSTLVVSCSQSEQEKIEYKQVETKELNSSNKVYLDKNPAMKIEGIEKNIEQAKLVDHNLSNKTLSFNGEKYLYDGKNLRKGSEVRNIYMSEKGRVKGTFVIVAKAEKILTIAVKSQTKIAKNTFRLVPQQTDDLMTFYHQLLLNKSIVSVELEVDYSRALTDAAEY
jgi:hypothetical protein